MMDVGEHYDTQARANYKAFSEFHGRYNDGDSTSIMEQDRRGGDLTIFT